MDLPGWTLQLPDSSFSKVPWPVFELTDSVKIPLPATFTYPQSKLTFNLDDYGKKGRKENIMPR